MEKWEVRWKLLLRPQGLGGQEVVLRMIQFNYMLCRMQQRIIAAFLRFGNKGNESAGKEPKHCSRGPGKASFPDTAWRSGASV